MPTVLVGADDIPPPAASPPVRGRAWWASCGATWGALAGLLVQGARVMDGADYTFTTTYDVLGWELFTHRTPMADMADKLAFDAAIVAAIAAEFGVAGAAVGLGARSPRVWTRHA